MRKDDDAILLQGFVRSFLVPAKDAGKLRTRRVDLVNVSVSRHRTVLLFLVHCFFQLCDGSIKAAPFQPPHSSANQFLVVAGKGEVSDIVPLYRAVDFEEQPVCDLVVLGSPRLPEVKPVTDDAARGNRENVGEQRERGRELLIWIVANVALPLFGGIVAGYACSWIHWNLFT
jgi:hypothetical protein